MSPTSKSPATDSISQTPIEESGKTCGYSTKYLIIFSAATVVVVAAVALTLFFVLQNPGTAEKLSRPGGNGSEPDLLGATTEDSMEVPRVPGGTEGSETSTILSGAAAEGPTGLPDTTKDSGMPSTLLEAPTTLQTPSEAAKPSKTPTIQPPLPDDPDELIYAQTLFRHGARAPDLKLSAELKKLFPNGKGKLTERGKNNSFLLGNFFRERYVKTGFLDQEVNNKQMKWLSRDNSRCVKTAKYVARGMFQTKKKKHVNVDVIAPLSDGLLNFQKSRCHTIDAYKWRLCPQLFNETRLENKEHKIDILNECIGTNNSIFSKLHIKASESDVFINMHRNGLQNPKEIEDNYEEICQEFLKLRNLYNGIGNMRVIQTKFGHLMNKLLTDLQSAWDKYEEGRLDVKFRVYSTQDWVIGGILDAFNLLTHIQSKEPREEPGYNTMILMELWKRDDEPFVKFHFKPEEVTEKNHQLQDLTDLVPRCQGSEDCSLENFTRCCDFTRIDEETLNEVCYPDMDNRKKQQNKKKKRE